MPTACEATNGSVFQRLLNCMFIRKFEKKKPTAALYTETDKFSQEF